MVKAEYTESFLARFWKKVEKGDGCWRWAAARSSDGYGRIGVRGKSRKAHRVSWVIHHGEIPYGIHVLHRCDNPQCTNPEHLFLGTHTDNMADKVSKGRCVKGELHGRAKLTPGLVRLIRRTDESARDIAKRLGVSTRSVSNVRSKTFWRHVAD